MHKIKLILSKISGYDSLAIAFTFVAIVATYIRLYFGVDFTDEAYYVARAYQYVLGAKPWVDDISLIPFAILIVPFVKLYYWIVGNTDGIILFTRHLYYLLNCLVASLVFLYIRTLIRWSTALLIASICVVFIPFNIPNLSYNTMGIGFFTAGCCWGIWVISTRRNPAYLLFSGFCHGLAIFSYPTLLIASSIYILLLVCLCEVRKIQALLAYFLGELPLALLLLNLILDSGISNVLISREYARSLGYSANTEKLYSVMSFLGGAYIYTLPFFFALTFLNIISAKKRRRLGAFSKVLLLVPLLVIPIIYYAYELECGCRFSIGYLFYYSTLAPYFLLFISADKELQKVFYLLWCPSFIAGLVIAYTSGNGYVSAGLGMLGASIATTILLIKSFLKFTNNTLNKKNLYGELIPPCLVVTLLVFSQYYLPKVDSITYRDADIYKLTSRIESGPFAGLYTSQEKKEYLAELSNDLKAVYRQGDRVLFYYNNFPAGYLLTSMRSATKVSFWVSSERYKSEKVRQNITNYINQKLEKYRVVAIKIKKVLLWDYYTFEDTGSDFISKTIEEQKNSKFILDKKNYSISIIEK
jgi:hypothetical protein